MHNSVEKMFSFWFTNSCNESTGSITSTENFIRFDRELFTERATPVTCGLSNLVAQTVR